MKSSGTESYVASVLSLDSERTCSIELTESSILTLRTIRHEPVINFSLPQRGNVHCSSLSLSTDYSSPKSWTSQLSLLKNAESVSSNRKSFSRSKSGLFMQRFAVLILIFETSLVACTTRDSSSLSLTKGT